MLITLYMNNHSYVNPNLLFLEKNKKQAINPMNIGFIACLVNDFFESFVDTNEMISSFF